MGQTKKKIMILLPDGVGLRNFAYTSFAAIGEQMGWKMIYWNKTPFDLSSLGLHEIPLQGKVSTRTNIYKRARKEIELANFEIPAPLYFRIKLATHLFLIFCFNVLAAGGKL